MFHLPAFSRRLLAAVLTPLALLGAAGCQDDPFIAEDTRVLVKSPGYLRAAYIYASKDAADDAAGHFRAGDYRMCALVSHDEYNFGEHYPGCAPGVGERYARRYGTVLLPRTAGAVEFDAQETYRNVAWNYAAAYNHALVALLGTLDAHPHGGGTVTVDK